MKEQTVTITLEEYKQLRAMCEELIRIEGDYKYLYHLYKEQKQILSEYEKYFVTQQEEIVETEKNPIGFNR